MPVRIYALAKDLKIDSKELADLCVKAGIPGKGSALASLEDDEVSKLKAYLDNVQAKKGGAAAPAAPGEKARIGAPIRPGKDVVPVAKNPATIPVVRTRPAEPVAVESEAEATVADPSPEVPVAEAPVARTPRAKPTPVVVAEPPEREGTGEDSADEKPSRGKPAQVAEELRPEVAAETEVEPVSRGPLSRESGAPSREDRNAPFRGATGRGPIRVLGGGPKSGGGVGKIRERESATAGPRFAALPEIKQPPQPKVGPAGANVLKPIVSLAPSQLKTGASLETVTKTLEKKHADAGKRAKPGAAGAAGTTPAGPLANRAGKAKKGRTPEEDARDRKAGGGMDAIRAQRQTNRGKRGFEDDGRSRFGRSRRRGGITRIGNHSTTAPRKGKVQVEIPATVRSFSEQAGASTKEVMGVLFKTMGLMVTINSAIPDEYVELLAAELGLDVEFKEPESLEDQLLEKFAEEDAPETLETRPPIVTFLGHVDHGKTSLLDRIIGINVVSGEAGGITQHIRAYQVETKSGRKIAFVDTPGHEAFTEMRARGANVTDIAVLVVAADDGIMRQTEEAIAHAKAAGVPIVVALNKIDLPGANPQRVLEQLAANELLPSEWGGEVEVVRTSAITGEGMDELLQTILLVADIHDYKANPNRAANGTCIEAEQESGRGIIAKVMVRSGTLREGDVIVCGSAHGRVKAMYDALNGRTRIKEAGPSMPVNVTGLDQAPNAGDALYAIEDIAKAREIAEQRAAFSREQSLAGTSKKVSLEEFQRRLAEGSVGQADEYATLNLIIRADVRGSIEAINKELSKFDHPEVQIRVLQAAVGGISVGDVTLASASDAVIIGFNVIPDEAARSLAEERDVEIRRYDIIYKVTDDIRALLEGKLKPEERTVELGRVAVKQVFNISRVGAVAGCYVIQGTVERNSRVQVFRDGRMIGDYAVDTLRREKEDVREVPRGMECGIKLTNFNDIKPDDVLQVYKIEEVARTL